ncbi:hypothetical protein BDK61_2972 [Haloarcula quadrata]|uniref:Uncharacterized protein n=1 Tax=Haloarcula quadrata TaxID=182779 RepID=A0A495R911_9EURY|nr:hypothetical protein BDK61_2972 [Haloarcula quadrata]
MVVPAEGVKTMLKTSVIVHFPPLITVISKFVGNMGEFTVVWLWVVFFTPV